MPGRKGPPELVTDSFKHLIGVKEMYARNGTYKIRTITIARGEKRDDLGFTLRQGDGWGKTDGVFVSRVRFGSTFDVCQVISIGDEVIKINDQNVKDNHIADALRIMYGLPSFTITVKIKTPFLTNRSAKRWKFIKQPLCNSDIDYKILNMKLNLPKKERHIYKEVAEEEVEEVEENMC